MSDEKGFQRRVLLTKDGPKEITKTEADALGFSPEPIANGLGQRIAFTNGEPSIAVDEVLALRDGLDAAKANLDALRTASNEAIDALTNDRNRLRDAPQTFFAGLAASARMPGFGEKEREYTKHILLRAQEANLYTPEGT